MELAEVATVPEAAAREVKRVKEEPAMGALREEMQRTTSTPRCRAHHLT